METIAPDVAPALRQLIDDYRDRCLWFLRCDYYPTTTEDAAKVLDAIQRHGDLSAFRRAAEIRVWLSRHSSETSAGS